jgi:small subunit ribosomal protein S16
VAVPVGPVHVITQKEIHTEFRRHMLRIRLRRVGAKKQPSYRIVIAEKTAPRDGKFLEVVGFYNPRTEPETVTIKEERVMHWLSVGAQPSDAVARIFKTHGTMGRFERLRAGESLSVLVAEAETSALAASKTVVVSEPEPVVAAVEAEAEAEAEVEDVVEEQES